MDYIAKGKVSEELVHRSIENIINAMEESNLSGNPRINRKQEQEIITPYYERIKGWLKEMHEELHKGNFFEAGGISALVYEEAKHFFLNEWGDEITFNTIHGELEAIQSKIKTSVRR